MSRCLLVLLVLLLLPYTEAEGWLSCFKCPTDVSYDTKCLKSAIPPWPVWLFHDAKYWVDSALDGATRCCADNSIDCRCPKKDTKRFKENIVAWCVDVAGCNK